MIVVSQTVHPQMKTAYFFMMISKSDECDVTSVLRAWLTNSEFLWTNLLQAHSSHFLGQVCLSQKVSLFKMLFVCDTLWQYVKLDFSWCHFVENGWVH